jgi:hypothetical protein
LNELENHRLVKGAKEVSQSHPGREKAGTDGERLIRTLIGLFARDDTCVRLKDPFAALKFAQTCDVIDGFIVELRTKRPKYSANQ